MGSEYWDLCNGIVKDEPMTAQHDYKAVIEVCKSPDISSTRIELSLNIAQYMAIRSALLIADKLMQSPSEEMFAKGTAEIEGCKKLGIKSHAAYCFTAMRDQMIKECE